MSANHREDVQGEVGQWGLVALFWVFVGIPLAWGIVETLIKASKLF